MPSHFRVAVGSLEQTVPFAFGTPALQQAPVSAVPAAQQPPVSGAPAAQQTEESGVPLAQQALDWATPFAQQIEARGVCMTPVPGSQESAVQTFPSSTTGGAPGRHVPDPSHDSGPLQAFPSEQDVLTGLETTVQVAVPLQVLDVQASDVQVTVPPPPHVPAPSQVVPYVHAAPAQAAPATVWAGCQSPSMQSQVTQSVSVFVPGQVGGRRMA